MSATEFCEGKPYDAGSLRGWSSRLGQAGKVPRSPRGRRPKNAPPRSAVAFARVVTKQESTRPGTSNLAASVGRALVIMIGPTRIEILPGFDPALLRSVVAALAAGAS